jgi:membrane dipeptidase
LGDPIGEDAAMSRVPIVDAHLDLAWNFLKGRNLDLTTEELRAIEKRDREQVMATLPELKRGDVAVAFGTLYTGTAEYDDDGVGIYKEPPDETARRQLDVYREWENQGKIRIVRTRGDLKTHLDLWGDDGKLGIVVLIEGGDSISSPDDLGDWWDAGVRVIGPAWSATRYCGGTRRPGPLTPMGRELIAAMKEQGVILDISHMSDESVWGALDIPSHRVIATHANVRSIAQFRFPERHLSDEMIAALAERDGVIGIIPANAFLDFGWDPEKAKPLTLDAVKKHLDHIAAIAGWDKVGIGSDLDGGFGREETPTELDTAADIGKVGDIVPADVREGVLGGNWLRVLEESLPD